MMNLSEALQTLVEAGIVTTDWRTLRDVASRNEGKDDPVADAAWIVWSALEGISA